MAVPDTTTFTLQDVVDEINPTTNDLVSCFTDANAANFDPTYEGSKNSLLNFRNYQDVIIITSFIVTTTGKDNSTEACNDIGANDTKYHNGSGTYPTNGDTVYTDSNGTITFDGASKWYRNVEGGTSIKIDSIGVVIDVSVCI